MRDEENPWKKIGTRLVYENPWITLREDKVIRPDGKEGIYSVVDTRVATGVLALSERDEAYLIGQFRYPIDLYSWEIVEGGADRGEEPIVAAKRELREEAGLIASEWQQLGPRLHLSNCFTSEVAYLYLARGLEEVESEPDGTEVLKRMAVPFPKCVEMVESGAITDAMSVVAILRAQKLISL